MSDNDTTDIYSLMNRMGVPYSVNFELTALCNLDCIHCYHVKTYGSELTTNEIKKLFHKLADLGTMELTLTGGEPLLRSDFNDILKYAVEITGFSVKLFSNLTLLDESIANILASLPLNAVETTLLGPNPETHDTIVKQPGSFNAVLRAVKLLKERNVSVTAKTIIMKSNSDKLGEMYNLAEKLDIPFRHDDVVFVESDGRRTPLSQQIPDNEVLRSRNFYGQQMLYEPVKCNAARSVMSIGPDGSVYPCGAFTQPAGNIRETSLRELWYEAPLMRRVRALEDHDYLLCKGCTYLLRCNGCIAMGIGLARGRIYRCLLARKRLRNLT